MAENRNRVVVFGVDGATPSLIERWVGEGLLPAFGRLLEHGATGPLASTQPAHTPTAWTSFMTGVNAGKHGIFDFQQRRAGSYAFRPINASHRRVATLWKVAGEHGLRTVVVNVPLTYPPEEVNGAMITGLGTPETATDYTHPASLRAEIESRFPAYRIETPMVRRDRVHTDERRAEFLKLVRQRADLAVHMMEHEDWDLFVVVFVATDRVQHDFWHFMDETHSRHDPNAPESMKTVIRDVYVEVDKALGRLMERFDDSTNLVIMSDHGAGPSEQVFDLNKWLAEKGYFRPVAGLQDQRRRAASNLGYRVTELRRRVPRGLRRVLRRLLRFRASQLFHGSRDLAADWPRTKAYAQGTVGSIRINLRGREPEGCVEPGEEYEALCREIAGALVAEADPESGVAVVDSVAHRDELYAGAAMKDMPDLVPLGEGPIRCSPNVRRTGGEGDGLLAPDLWSGWHRQDGTFMMYGPAAGKGRRVTDVRIIDVAPTVLHLLGIPIPGYMDGRVAEQAFDEAFLSTHEIRYSGSDDAGGPPPDEPVQELSDSDAGEVADRLRALGYL